MFNQQRAFAFDADDSTANLSCGRVSADPANQKFLSVSTHESARNVLIAVTQGLFDFRQSDIVLMQTMLIDQHVKLLAFTPHDNDLGNSRYLSQSLSHHPVRLCANFERAGLARLAPHPDHHDLAHNR